MTAIYQLIYARFEPFDLESTLVKAGRVLSLFNGRWVCSDTYEVKKLTLSDFPFASVPRLKQSAYQIKTIQLMAPVVRLERTTSRLQGECYYQLS